jgi:RHS repeat-associated protein
VSKAFVNGELLYTLTWDAEGRIEKATFKDGHVLQPSYDAATLRRRGYSVSGPAVNASVSFDLNARGQVARETYSDSTTTRHVAHTYDERGLLLNSEDEANKSAYLYTASGLPRWAQDRESERTVLRGATSSNVGGTVYGWDALGRVTRRGDTTLEYGPSGEVDIARNGLREARYYYDETGQRVLKEVSGKPVRAYFEGGVLTDTSLITHVSIDGMLVGFVENGAFRFIATNQLGTPFLNEAGKLDPSTAYGVRESRTASADVLDFVRLGYDADLGTVRMGVRDYDPVLAQFWTPDPLFFEELERSQESPLEANLFGYARGNPLSFVDPSGLISLDFSLSGGVVYGVTVTISLDLETGDVSLSTGEGVGIGIGASLGMTKSFGNAPDGETLAVSGSAGDLVGANAAGWYSDGQDADGPGFGCSLTVGVGFGAGVAATVGQTEVIYNVFDSEKKSSK